MSKTKIKKQDPLLLFKIFFGGYLILLASIIVRKGFAGLGYIDYIAVIAIPLVFIYQKNKLSRIQNEAPKEKAPVSTVDNKQNDDDIIDVEVFQRDQ